MEREIHKVILHITTDAEKLISKFHYRTLANRLIMDVFEKGGFQYNQGSQYILETENTIDEVKALIAGVLLDNEWLVECLLSLRIKYDDAKYDFGEELAARKRDMFPE